MSVAARTASLFDIRPGERRLVGSLMLIAFFMGLTFVFVQVPALALFVESFGSEGLPLLYIAVAIISTVVSYIYLLIGLWIPFPLLMVINFGSIAAGTVVIHNMLDTNSSKWLLFGLPIWFEVITTLGWIGFGTLQNRLFDVRQGRRLLGVIRMMVPGANIVGGFAVSMLSQRVETIDLFLISALACGILLVLMTVLILRVYYRKLTQSQDDVQSLSRLKEPRSRSGFRRRYILSIFLLISVWWIAFYFVDNIFYDLLEMQFSTRAEIASFLGIFFGMVQGSLLLMGNLFTSRIIQGVGMRAAVLLLPFSMLLLIGGLIAAETLGTTATILFAFGAAAKLANGAIGFSLDTNARTLLYQPLPTGERTRIQTIGQGIIEPLSIGLVGAVLLLLTGVYGLEALDLARIFIGIGVAWVLIAILTLTAYPKALKQAITKRRLGEGTLSFTDKASIRLLRQELESPYPEAVIYSMSVLEQVDATYLGEYLPKLLRHPAFEVRHQALVHIEHLHLTSAIEAVKSQITADIPAEVRQAALSTLIALGGQSSFNEVLLYMNYPDPTVQRGAIVGMLRHGENMGKRAAYERLKELTNSAYPKERMVVTGTAFDTGDQGLIENIYTLIYDDNLQVRRAAILAAGKIRKGDLLVDVTRAMEQPGLRTDAAQALIFAGAIAIPHIQKAFLHPDTKRDLQVRLARVMGRIGGSNVLQFLRQRINYPDEEVRTQILSSLSTADYTARGEMRKRVQEQIYAEAELMAHSLLMYHDLGKDPKVRLLASALQNDIDQTRDRIFYLLSFLYDRRAMLQARDALMNGNPQQNAYALEVLDNSVSRDIRPYLIPLVDNIPDKERFQKLAAYIGLPKSKSRDEHLHDLIRQDADDLNPWMTLYALYTVSQMEDEEFIETISETAYTPDLLIRETALWTLKKLDPRRYNSLVDFLGHPGSEFDRDAANMGEKDKMYSTIEKIVILKTISIFEQTPSDVLVDIANLMDVVDYKKGQIIFNKGDMGNSMYIIVSGRVRVHDGDVALNTLSDRDVFGELALLDPEPRVATVTALQDTTLFRLDQEPFYELIADRGEVARGIMKVLVRTIRTSARDRSVEHDKDARPAAKTQAAKGGAKTQLSKPATSPKKPASSGKRPAQQPKKSKS